MKIENPNTVKVTLEPSDVYLFRALQQYCQVSNDCKMCPFYGMTINCDAIFQSLSKGFKRLIEQSDNNLTFEVDAEL